MKRIQNLTLALIMGIAAGLSACDSSLDGEIGSAGKASIALTDAAVDAGSITGVYLTVGEIQARSTSETKTIVQFESPKTFNVMDYQNGATLELGEGELEAGAYNELQLVLEEGAAKNYVQFTDGTTSELHIDGGSTYRMNGTFDIAANSTSKLIADIDLRKALIAENEGDFRLRTTGRVVNRENTGAIKGSISGSDQDQVVIYAYARGTYDASEADEPEAGETRFEGSVNSAVVSNGSFTLAFMEEGAYDLIAVTYERNEAENRMEFKNATKAEVMLGGQLTDLLEIKANTTANVLINLSF